MAGTSFKNRRGTSQQWSLADPVLQDGEFGVDKDTGIIKVGDGITNWTDLPVALRSAYLPILGKAADSDKLDGRDSTEFLLRTDATDASTAGAVVRRSADNAFAVSRITGLAAPAQADAAVNKAYSDLKAPINNPVFTGVATAPRLILTGPPMTGGVASTDAPLQIGVTGALRIFMDNDELWAVDATGAVAKFFINADMRTGSGITPISGASYVNKSYVDALTDDTGWGDWTLASGWTRQYAKFKVKAGVFHFTISATRSGGWTAGTGLAQLSASYKPGFDWRVIGIYSGTPYEIFINASTGAVTMVAAGGNNGIVVAGSFPIG